MTVMSKVNKIAKTARLVFDNGNGRKVYRVNSDRTGNPYQVKTTVTVNGIIKVEIELYTYNHKEQVNSKGNHIADFNRSTVCKQALAAIKARVKESGKVLSICLGDYGYQNAKKLLNFGGKLVLIKNLGGGAVWGVVR